MNKLILASCILFGIAACRSNPVDSDNNISNASYRKAIEESRDKVANLTSRLLVAKQDDLANVATKTPVHSADWWDAQVGVAAAVRNYLSDALVGSNK